MKNALITVLNDGETWTETAGTKVVVLKPEQYEKMLENFVEPSSSDFEYFMMYDLSDPAHLRSLATYLEAHR